MEYVHILLNPLEFISSIEEPNIRETAIQSAKKLAVGQSEDFFTNHFYEMVKRLVMWDNYTSKISGTSLIPTCFRHLPQDKHPGLKSVVKELGKEDTPMVRRAVAGILSELCEIYDKESFKTDLKPMLYMFLAEEIDSVKMKALEQMAVMAKYIDQEERDTNLLDFILKMDAGNKNWRIRYHLPDSLTSIIETLSFETIKTKVVPFYQGLLKDSEHEVRSNALTQFETLSRTLHLKFDQKDLTYPLLLTIKELLQDQSHHVRNTMINVLSSSVQHISEKFIQQDLLEILLSMLKDSIIEVKLSAIRNFHFFYPYLDRKVIKDRIVSEFKILGQDKNWKIRFEVLKGAPHLLNLKNDEFLEDFVFFNDQHRDDHIYCIRERISQNLVDCYTQEHNTKLDEVIINLVNYWSMCNNYIFRVSCLQLISKFIGILRVEVFHKLLNEIVTRLKKDKLVLEFMDKTDSEFRQQFIAPLVEELKDDKDPDMIHLLELIKEKM